MTKEKDKFIPSTIIGNTDKLLPTAAQIEEYIKELGISVEEFMKHII